MATYYEEAAHLEKEYWKAVGEALELRIKVYIPGSGGQMKTLGDLRDEIDRARPRSFEPSTSSYLNGLTQAYCTNGHAAVLWGGVPMRAKPHEQVRWWGAPFLCHCGAEVFGGYRGRHRR